MSELRGTEIADARGHDNGGQRSEAQETFEDVEEQPPADATGVRRPAGPADRLGPAVVADQLDQVVAVVGHPAMVGKPVAPERNTARPGSVNARSATGKRST